MGEIAALLRRHIAAVIAVIAATAMAGYGIARAPVRYQESGTLDFLLPPAPWQSKLTARHGITQVTQGETPVAALLSILIMSTHGQRQVRSAGAAAGFDVAPLNLGSLQWPNYSPEITVTTSGVDPAQVRTSFAVVRRVLDSDFAALQVQAGAPARYRMTIGVSANPSLEAELGSQPRMYGGLAALAVVAAFAAVILLERRRPRSATAHRPGAPGPGIAAARRC